LVVNSALDQCFVEIIVIDRTKANEELKLIWDKCCLRRKLSFPFEVNLQQWGLKSFNL